MSENTIRNEISKIENKIIEIEEETMKKMAYAKKAIDNEFDLKINEINDKLNNKQKKFENILENLKNEKLRAVELRGHVKKGEVGPEQHKLEEAIRKVKNLKKETSKLKFEVKSFKAELKLLNFEKKSCLSIKLKEINKWKRLQLLPLIRERKALSKELKILQKAS